MKWVIKLFKLGTLISLISMIAVVSIQVFARFFLEAAPHWTEEAARIFFIYTVAFGTGLGINDNSFIRLDLIEQYLPIGMSYWLDFIINIFTIVFAVFMITGSFYFIRMGLDERSPALEISMAFIFFSTAIIGFAIGIFTLKHLFINKGKKGRL